MNSSGIKWLPWIGDNYFDHDENLRILIVGESHYYKDLNQASIDKINKKTFTRIVIDEIANYGQKYPTFSNFHRILFEKDSFDTFSPFWKNVSFFNFVQKPMYTNKGRPTYNDFYDGWKTFFDVVKILKPQTCIFIGTTAANSFMHAIKDTSFFSAGVRWEEKIGNSYAKTAIANDDENRQIKIIFIRHTGWCSWRKWRTYLQKTIPTELTWLENQVSLQLAVDK